MEIQLWREILNPYELAVKELTVKFNHLIKEHRQLDIYCPIEQVTGRVKSINSILEKMQRKNITWGNMEVQVEDIAGMRIICQFYEDIEKVVEIIRSRSDMSVKYEKDYITHMKESGYRSYHMLVTVPVQTTTGSVQTKVEIQIRTIAMDFWASLEHKIYYKFEGNAPEYISRDLQECAAIVSKLDAKMLSLNEAIMEAKAENEAEAKAGEKGYGAAG